MINDYTLTERLYNNRRNTNNNPDFYEILILENIIKIIHEFTHIVHFPYSEMNFSENYKNFHIKSTI